MNSYDTKTWAWEAQVNALKSELEVLAAQNRQLVAALREIKDRLFTQSCTCSFAVDEIIARAALANIETPTASAAENTDEP